MTMARDRQAPNRNRREARPLDAARLDELALTYVARFATSAAKLERYGESFVKLINEWEPA